MIKITNIVIIAIVIIRLVAILVIVSPHLQVNSMDLLPPRHAPQRLDAPVRIPLTLQQRFPRMTNRLPLPRQILQNPRPNTLRLIRNPLCLRQSPTTPRQPLRPGQQLLPLLQLLIHRVIGISVPKQRGAVASEREQFSLDAIDIALVVAEALVYFRALRGGDACFFHLHRGDLWEWLLAVCTRCTASTGAHKLFGLF